MLMVQKIKFLVQQALINHNMILIKKIQKTGLKVLIVPNTTDIVKKSDFNEIPDVIGLVTKPTLNAKVAEIQNKIPDTIGLVTKTDYKRYRN